VQKAVHRSCLPSEIYERCCCFSLLPSYMLVLFVGGGTLIVPCRKTPMPCISSRVARAEEGTRTALPLFRECAEGIGNCLGKLAKCREANIALL